MVKFTVLQIALLVLVIALIVYLIFTRKKKDNKENKMENEGNFEKVLRSMKNTEYIIPSRYEEENNRSERIIQFPKQETNDIANEWIQNFVKSYCNKTIDFKLPARLNDMIKVYSVGMIFMILDNPKKTIDEKKDDLGMWFIIFSVAENNVKYKILEDNKVELPINSASALGLDNNIISFKQFKDAIYESQYNIYINNEEGKRKFREQRKKYENLQNYIIRSDDEINQMYENQYNELKDKAQVYCQNI